MKKMLLLIVVVASVVSDGIEAQDAGGVIEAAAGLKWQQVQFVIAGVIADRDAGVLLTAGRDGGPITPSQAYVGRIKKLFARLGIIWDAAPRKDPQVAL